jgi:membrane dipeptidase
MMRLTVIPFFVMMNLPKLFGTALLGSFTAVLLNAGPDPDLAAERADWSEVRLLSLAKEIHDQHLTLDTHLDVPIVLRRPGFDISQEHSWVDDASQVDFPRMRKGGLDGGFFVVFVRQGPLNLAARTTAIEEGFLISNLIRETVELNADISGLATTPAEAMALREQGKHVVFMGIENGYVIGRNIDLLEEYYDLGVRYFGLVHTRNNDLADSSTDRSGPRHYGISALGKVAVEECNRLGIMIDVSHASDKSTWDILKYSQAPVLASHSGAYAAYPHPRNLNDPLLREIAAQGGVVQMNVFGIYLEDTPPDDERDAAIAAWRTKYDAKAPWSMEVDIQRRIEIMGIKNEFPSSMSDIPTVADHVDHLVKVMGIDHVGFSGDFDGGGGVMDLMDVSEMMNLTAELLRRGYSAADLGQMWGGNVMRVLGEVQEVAATLQAGT